MKSHPYKGTYIVFEGPGGCGKSLQAFWLGKFLEEKFSDREIVKISEPGSTPVANSIRQILLDQKSWEMEPLTEILLFAAARAEVMIKMIKPSLERGAIVLADRSIFSNMVYQGIARQQKADLVWQLNSETVKNLFPDVVFFPRVESETGWQRVVKEKNFLKDRFDGDREYYERVCRGYDWLAEQYPQLFVVIDGNLPVTELSEVVRERTFSLVRERDLNKEGIIGKERE